MKNAAEKKPEQTKPTVEEIDGIKKNLQSVFANHMSYIVRENPRDENQQMATINLRHKVNELLDMLIDEKKN